MPNHDPGARAWTQRSTNHQKCCICDIDGGFFMVVRRYDIMPQWHRNGPNTLSNHAIQHRNLTLTQDINNEGNPNLTKCEKMPIFLFYELLGKILT